MDIKRRNRPGSTFWILHVSGWLAYAGSMAIISYRGGWTDISRLLLVMLPFIGGFLICIPLRYFYKTTRFHERPLKQAILTALAASFIGTNLWLGIDLVISLFVPQPQGPQMPFIQVYVSYLLNGGTPLLGWTSLYFGIKIRREWKQQERRTEQANSLAQTAQLQMLRHQLNPHFLFNSMNSIRALIDEDEAKAREMITELSEFLRYSLVSKNYSDVPLKEEMEAIRHFLAIQKKRYEDKLEVIYDIEPEAGEFPVLSFLIHPLVENAIKYGMRTSPMPLTIHLKAVVRDGVLSMEIFNTGKWIEPAEGGDRAGAGTGTGLENVRRRLDNAFPTRYRFDIIKKEDGVRVQLALRSSSGKADGQTF
jgi:two-component system LytT family sensor kinase